MRTQNSALKDWLTPVLEKSKTENIDPEVVSLIGQVVNSSTGNPLDEASVRKVLDYLDQHKKLLDDAVYPHLRTQIESMKKGK